MGSLARLVVVSLAVDGGLWLARADDPLPPDPARKARVALALAADAGRHGRVAAALADACTCSAAKALPWPEARAKAMADREVVVAFFGGAAVRCCADAIPGTLPTVPAGYSPAKPVVVFAPVKTGLQVVAELPADAPASAVKAAVEAARKQVGK